MTDDVFTEPEATHDESETDHGEWVDVRMTDPEKGEWDVDVVVVGGRVEYVDLRVEASRLHSFVECLVDDVGAERASEVLRDVADEQDLEV
jgi:hypothetical protein